MPYYRASTIGKDGHFNSFEVIESPTDEKAIKVAQKLLDGHNVELWIGARKVVRSN